MQRGTRSNQFQPDSTREAPSPAYLGNLALRSWGQLYEMNLSAARVMLQTQARAASAFGLPDWSPWFESIDARSRQVFLAGADQFATTAQQPTEAALELQREVTRVVDSQASTVAQTLQQGLEELGAQTAEGLIQLVDTAREQADRAERVTAEFGDRVRRAIEDGGAQVKRGREGALQAVDAMNDTQTDSDSDAGDVRSRRRRSA